MSPAKAGFKIKVSQKKWRSIFNTLTSIWWRNVNAMLWALFFLLLFILLFCTTSYAGSNGKLDRLASLTIDANQQFEFAQHHFTAKAYGMAIIEYQRFLYFFPEDERVALALYNIGMSYYSTNRFQEAVASFEKVIDQHDGTELSVKSYYMKSKSLTKLNASGSAVINLQNLIAITDDINVKDEAYYQIGWIYLNMASWEKAASYFAKISPQNADKYKLDDSYIEHIFMFAPLHDIGKIGIPDNILLKPDKLNDNERETMKTHVHKGRAMIDDLLNNFGLDNVEHLGMLRNIAEFHHEKVNGKGYPSGKKGGEIPLEARIIAVADVFDALTSKRPYKEAWDNQRAIDMLQKLAGETLDQDCVDALLKNLGTVEEIQKQFQENIYG